MDFAKRLKDLRQSKNLSQEKLAEALGISRQAVSKWETGLSQPDTGNLIKLSEIFNVSLNELTGLPNPPEEHSIPEKNVLSIPRIVFWAYIISFISIVGFFSPTVSNLPHPYGLWIGIGFIGGIMLVIKNRKLNNPEDQQKILLMDTGIILLGCILGIFVPRELGLVKPLIILIPLAYYMKWVSMKYFMSDENIQKFSSD